MPLSRDDLAKIRQIVRDEIEEALAYWRGNAKTASLDDDPALDEKSWNWDEYFAKNQPHWDELQRKRDERAARPIPDTPFVDIYDARRLLNDATGVTANAWMRRGRLKRHRVDDKLQFSRAEIDAILADSTKPKRR